MRFMGASAAGERRPIQHLLGDSGWLALSAPALLFLGLALYGAMVPQTALGLSCLWAAVVAICLLELRLRAGLGRVRGLGTPALAFVVVLVVALLSLTPFAPGGPHPVWAYLGISPAAATVDKSQTQLEILKLLGLACVFVVGVASGTSDSRARLAVNTTLALGSAYALWAFVAFVTTRGPGHSRLEASVQSANTAGTILAVLFVLAMGPLASHLRSDSRRRLTAAAPYGVAALLFLTGLLMTASRGAFLAALAGLVVILALYLFGRKARAARVLLVGGGVLGAVLALLATGGSFLLDRMLGASEGAASRAAVAQAHWGAFETSPLMGFGLGNFDTVNRMLLNDSNILELWSVRSAHNIYLGWLEQAGLLGAIPMLVCVGALVLATWRNSLGRLRSVSLLFALLGIDAVFLVHGASDFALDMFGVAALWAYLLGMQFALAQGSSALRRRPVRHMLPAATGLAVASLVLAVLGLLSFTGTETPVQSADAHDRRAMELLNRSLAPESLAAAEAELEKALRLAPYRNTARLRLTYIDTVRRGSLGPIGSAHLARSYELVPLDHTVAAWRVKYCLEHWRQLTPDVRAAVGKEVMAFGRTGSRDANVRAVLLSVENPEGRVAAALWRVALAR